MLEVYITIDTEVWWEASDISNFRRDYERWFLGKTPAGNYGVPYQIEVLNSHGLKAVYLVESLFACAVGLDPLREMVDVIQGGGQDVQLHVHTEWLELMAEPVISNRTGQHIRNFTEEEQTTLIKRTLDNLRAAGAENVCAFRAGNYGADFATLRALSRNNIPYDTSHNFCYFDSACAMRTDELLLQPRIIEKVLEFPIAFFEDWPSHYRPATLGACSFAEMKDALLQAWHRGWQTFVIVSHSFELLNARLTKPDPIVLRRFIKLCRFLADNRDKFHTAIFDGSFTPGISSARTPLQGSLVKTAWRVGEQVTRRMLYNR